MKTKQVYYQNPYLKELSCRIISIEEKGSLVNVILDQTIFYPEGGGQPSDRGIFESKSWSTKVEYVRLVNDEVIHQVKPDGEIKIGDRVKTRLDWNWRYKYMRIHSAGHLLHDVLMEMIKGLTPLRGSHGKKAFLEYGGNLDVEIKEVLEERVNKVIANNLSIVTKEASYQELEKECQFLPSNLPKTKKLRMIKIGDYPGMPDGGVHVKNTKEIGKIWIANIISREERVVIRYGVAYA
jgi:alanyl-tRNA synthetase